MTALDKINQRIAALPEGLQAHLQRVKEIAVELAQRHGIDPEQARLGALCHDVARAMTDKELLDWSARLHLPVGVVERHVPVLLHGPVGAELLRREDGLDDESVYQAVYWHTTAHPALDALGKVVFLADKLDPQKISRYPYQPELHQLALKDLGRAVMEFTTREISSLTNQGKMVHPMVVEARNHFISRLRSIEDQLLS